MPAVLVADDSRQLTELLRATLEEAGYEVLTAYSGLAAVAIAQQHEIAAAVIDVLMPGISGDATAERLRQVNPKLPVLLMTGPRGEAFVASAGLPVMHKPFDPQDLVRELRRLVPVDPE